MRDIFRLFVWFIFAGFLVSACFAQSKNSKKLTIEGTVVARERLYGHIYDGEKIEPKLLVVRVDKTISGNTGARHILVDYQWRMDDKDTPYDGEYPSRWTFKLSAEKICETSLERIQFVEFGRDEITGILPRFNRSWDLRPEPLDLKVQLPCYKLKRGNFSLIAWGKDEGIRMPSASKDFFVIEDDLWINLPGAPLALELRTNGIPLLRNISDEDVTDHSFGCVRKTAAGFTVSKAFPAEKSLIHPGPGILITNSNGTNDLMTPFKICRDLGSVLTVVKVGLAGGGVWEVR
jgi:hypothetical protein